jgi:hypothetical protein
MSVKKVNKNTMVRFWMFTSYAVNDFVLPYINVDTEDGKMKYLRYCNVQLEVCPETKRKHWQGYAEFSRSVRMGHLKRIFGDPAMHFDVRYGTQEEAIAYVEKEESRHRSNTRIVVGVKTPGQGRKFGLDEKPLDLAIELIMEGKKVKSLAMEHPKVLVLHGRGLDRLEKEVRAPAPMRSVKTIVHYGDSGAGKTRTVWDAHPREQIFRVPLPRGNDVWWTGYSGEPIILIDDMVHKFQYKQLLSLLDDYPLDLEVKGDHVRAEWNTVYICDVRPPRDWFPKSWDRQLERRLDEVWCFYGEYPGSRKIREKPEGMTEGVPVGGSVVVSDGAVSAVVVAQASPDICPEMDIEEEVLADTEEAENTDLALFRQQNRVYKFF